MITYGYLPVAINNNLLVTRNYLRTLYSNFIFIQILNIIALQNWKSYKQDSCHNDKASPLIKFMNNKENTNFSKILETNDIPNQCLSKGYAASQVIIIFDGRLLYYT